MDPVYHYCKEHINYPDAKPDDDESHCDTIRCDFTFCSCRYIVVILPDGTRKKRQLYKCEKRNWDSKRRIRYRKSKEEAVKRISALFDKKGNEI